MCKCVTVHRVVGNGAASTRGPRHLESYPCGWSGDDFRAKVAVPWTLGNSVSKRPRAAFWTYEISTAVTNRTVPAGKSEPTQTARSCRRPFPRVPGTSNNSTTRPGGAAHHRSLTQKKNYHIARCRSLPIACGLTSASLLLSLHFLLQGTSACHNPAPPLGASPPSLPRQRSAHPSPPSTPHTRPP